jgi:hypothetical protein
MSTAASGERSDWLSRLTLELTRAETFDEGVEAARNACAAGASLAAAVITAGAYYDNPFTGAPALRACMQRLTGLPLDLAAWRRALEPRPHDAAGVVMTPGFGFVATGREQVFFALLGTYAGPGAGRSRFVLEHREALARLAGPLNAAGLCALAFLDHDIDLDTAERQFWSLKIDVALREALAAQRAGVAAVPFGGVRYVYEGELPEPRRRDRRVLMQRLGLDGDGVGVGDGDGDAFGPERSPQPPARAAGGAT